GAPAETGGAPAETGGAPDSPAPVPGWVAGPEFDGADTSGPLGAEMAGSPPELGDEAPPPELGDDTAPPPLVSADEPLDDEPPLVDEDDPEELELPELLEPADEPESLGAIGAGPLSSPCARTAFATPAVPQNNPIPSPVAKAVLTTRCLIFMACLPAYPHQRCGRGHRNGAGLIFAASLRSIVELSIRSE
ncbi:MAG: hypothetical protein WCE30_11010, partial [Mycobacterium sp.]